MLYCHYMLTEFVDRPTDVILLFSPIICDVTLDLLTEFVDRPPVPALKHNLAIAYLLPISIVMQK